MEKIGCLSAVRSLVRRWSLSGLITLAANFAAAAVQVHISDDDDVASKEWRQEGGREAWYYPHNGGLSSADGAAVRRLFAPYLPWNGAKFRDGASLSKLM